MARVRRCLYRMPALRQAQGKRKRGFVPWRALRDRLRAVEGPSALRQAQGERKRGFAPWRAHRPFDRLRANGKRFAPWRAHRPFDKLRANGKEGSRRGGPIDPSTGSGRTEKRVPFLAHRPFDKLRANGKDRAVEGPSIRQAQREFSLHSFEGLFGIEGLLENRQRGEY